MIYVRAWIPPWGAQADTAGQPQALPKRIDGSFYELWFIGHTDPAHLTDEALDSMVAQAIDDDVLGPDGEEAAGFQDYMEACGYTSLTSAGTGQIYVAALPDEGE